MIPLTPTMKKRPHEVVPGCGGYGFTAYGRPCWQCGSEDFLKIKRIEFGGDHPHQSVNGYWCKQCGSLCGAIAAIWDTHAIPVTDTEETLNDNGCSYNFMGKQEYIGLSLLLAAFAAIGGFWWGQATCPESEVRSAYIVLAPDGTRVLKPPPEPTLGDLKRIERYIKDHPDVTPEELSVVTPADLKKMYPHIRDDGMTDP